MSRYGLRFERPDLRERFEQPGLERVDGEPVAVVLVYDAAAADLTGEDLDEQRARAAGAGDKLGEGQAQCAATPSRGSSANASAGGLPPSSRILRAACGPTSRPKGEPVTDTMWPLHPCPQQA